MKSLNSHFLTLFHDVPTEELIIVDFSFRNCIHTYILDIFGTFSDENEFSTLH